MPIDYSAVDTDTRSDLRAARGQRGERAGLQVDVLGPLEVRVGKELVPVTASKERAVLSLLALRAGGQVSTHELVDAVWGDDPPLTASKGLHTYVSHLRHLLPPACISTTPSGYRLRIDPEAVDALLFRQLVAGSRRQSLSASLRAAELTEALNLWRGDALTDLADHDIRGAEVARLSEMRRTAEEDLVDCRLAAGEADEIISDLEAAVHAEPLRERRWGQLITALYRSGRQADCLRAYRRLRTTLIESLGVEPSPALRQLEAAVLAQDGSLDLQVPTPAAPAPELPTNLPSGIVTFMVTDIVGSVRLWEVAPEAMTSAVARHDAAVSSAVSSNRGHELTAHGEGDSTLSVFQLATDAAVAAGVLQQSIEAQQWPEGCDIRVRIALHTGEALEREGEYFGRTVNRASRLKAISEPEEILMTRATAELLVEHLSRGLSLRAVGTRRLRDIARPESLYQLCVEAGWDPTRAETQQKPARDNVDIDTRLGTPPDLRRISGPLARAAPDPSFVGRLEEQAALQAWVREAIRGDPRFVVISGPPGIGKSALTSRLVTDLPDEVQLLAGACREGGNVAYLPLLAALEPLVSPGGAGLIGAAPRRLDARSDRGPRDAGVADLASSLGESLDWDGSTADRHQLQLFLTATRLLMSELAERPVILVIEDVHWADEATLSLLAHLLSVVARHGEGGLPAPILTLLTCRSRDKSSPFSKARRRLEREPGYRGIILSGLSGLETSELVARFRGARPAPDVVEALMEATDGNPWLVRSTLQRLTQSGAMVIGAGGRLVTRGEIAVGGSVDIDAEVVARLETVTSSCREMLTSAAFLGGRGLLSELRAVLGCTLEQLDDLLDEATEAELLEDDGAVWWFDHSELPRAIVGRTSRRRSRRIHIDIADRLEQHYGDTSLSHATIIARHLRLSGVTAQPERVRLYLSVAGDRAFTSASWSEAATDYDAVLEIDSRATTQTLELLVRSGIAHFRNHNHEAAQERLGRAVSFARELGVAQLSGIAALWLTKSRTISGSIREIDQGPLMEFVVEAEDDGSGLHARALAQLADARFAGLDVESGMDFARRALRAAEDAKDDQVRSEVELSLGLQHLVRLEVSDARACFQRCREAAERLHDPWAMSWASIRLPLLEWVEGRLVESDKLAAEAVEFTDRHYDSAESSLGLACRAAVAIDRGRFEEAELLAARARQHFIRSDYFYTMMVLAPSLIGGRTYRGDLAGAEEAIVMAADIGLDVRGYRLAARALAGSPREVRLELDSTPLPRRQPAPLNVFDLASAAVEVEIAAAIGDRTLAAGAFDILEAAHSRGVTFVVGWAASVPRLLGVASFLAGRPDTAQSSLQHAITTADRADAVGEAARARLDLARLLAETDHAGGRNRGLAELDAAISSFKRLGMTPFLRAARQLRERYT
jgi:DNA-binding SARP family transcriptional activator/tetratricopeptide (TPR) repeat protein